MGLLDKIKELPQGNSIDLAAPSNNQIEEIDDDQGNKEIVETNAPEKEGKEEPVKPETSEEDKEPAKDATQEVRDAYKQRKLKKADEDAKAAKADAEQARKEAKEAREQAEQWRKQAEAIASRPVAPVAQQTAQPQETSIDPNKDPVGYLVNEVNGIKKQYSTLENSLTVKAASDELSGMERAYADKAPDYNDVMKHAEDTEVKKALLINPKASEAAIRQKFKDDKVKAAVNFMVHGRDPVEGLYNYAKTAYGFQPKAQVESAEDKAAREKESKDAAEKARFAAVNKNKAKGASGLSAGGSAGDTELRGPDSTKGRKLKDFARLTKAQKDADYR